MSIAHPFRAGAALDPARFEKLRLRTIFECCKWDPQVEDTSVLATYPLLLPKPVWAELSQLAESLASETIAAESEILARPELLKQLALPRSIWKLLTAGEPASGPRVMRFDFHFTREGWRLSEVNSDVPGGYVEAEGFTRLMAEVCGGHELSGFPATRLAEALVRAAPTQNPAIALVHASAYTDDRQVMTFLARKIEEQGGRPVLIDPSQLRWIEGPKARAQIDSAWFQGEAHAIHRFFPAEWLPNLRRTCAWPRFFTQALTPQCNPGWSIVSQSKRFGIALQSLRVPTPLWKKFLPETRDPREVSTKDCGWILKPALGRVGEDIGMPGVTTPKDWKAICRDAFFFPNQWVAQRRFEMEPLATPDGPRHVCLGVYTVENRSAGIYARCHAGPIINHSAQDLAVLLEGLT